MDTSHNPHKEADAHRLSQLIDWSRDDTLYVGDDRLDSRKTDDRLYVEDGDNRLDSRKTDDKLDGDKGKDTFAVSPDDLAIIADFESGTDKLVRLSQNDGPDYQVITKGFYDSYNVMRILDEGTDGKCCPDCPCPKDSDAQPETDCPECNVELSVSSYADSTFGLFVG